MTTAGREDAERDVLTLEPAVSWRQRFGRMAAPLVVLAAGAGAAAYLMRTGPSAERRPAVVQARLVEVESVAWAARTALVEAVGVVVPARRVELRPEVSGTVVEVAANLEPGGLVLAGDVLLALDPRDFELAVDQRRADLAEAEAELRLEMGSQVVAEREFALLGEEISGVARELVLREPQLRTARARVERARAALRAAEIDRERTVLRAPFDAVVEDRFVERGSRIDGTAVAVALVARDEYWVEVGLPATDLRWIRLPDADGPGSAARVHPDAGDSGTVFRDGSVVRLRADLESEGRLARVLVSVPDPLATGRNGLAPLLLGAVVPVTIEGVVVEGIPIDRRHVREGDRVWVMRADDTLEIRTVTLGFRGRSEVFVTSGLEAGERLVTTDLATPVEGMALRVARARLDG